MQKRARNSQGFVYRQESKRWKSSHEPSMVPIIVPLINYAQTYSAEGEKTEGDVLFANRFSARKCSGSRFATHY